MFAWTLPATQILTCFGNPAAERQVDFGRLLSVQIRESDVSPHSECLFPFSEERSNRLVNPVLVFDVRQNQVFKSIGDLF